MTSWSFFGINLGVCERLLELTWRSWAPLGRFLGPSWAQFGALGLNLEPLGRNLEPLGRLCVPCTPICAALPGLFSAFL